MKVADLIRKLQGANPNDEVVLNGYDHSYRKVDYAGSAKAEVCETDDSMLVEFHTRASMADKTNKVVDVFLIN